MFNKIFTHIVFKNTVIYTAANILQSAIPFLLLPILTRFLTPADYGTVAIFQLIQAIVSILIGMSLRGAINVNFFSYNKEEIRIYIGNVLSIVFINFIIIISILYLFKSPISNLIEFPENWLTIAAVVGICEFIFHLALLLWQVEQRPIPYSVLQVLQVAFNISLSVILVVSLKMQWQGRVLGIVYANILFCIIAAIIISKRKYVKFSYNLTYIKDALLFGLPLIPHSLGVWIMSGIDRLFINNMVGVDATGLYTVGFQFGMIIAILGQSFNKSWYPFLFKKLKENVLSVKIKLVKISYLYFISITAAALVLSLVAPYIIKIFIGKEFQSSVQFVFWIALGKAAHGMYVLIANYIFYAKKTYILAWITLICAITNIVLNYILILKYGPIGAAQATAITYFAYFFLTLILSMKVYKMPWAFWRYKNI